MTKRRHAPLMTPTPCPECGRTSSICGRCYVQGGRFVREWNTAHGAVYDDQGVLVGTPGPDQGGVPVPARKKSRQVKSGQR